MKFKDFYESFSLSCWEQDSKKFHQLFERSLVMVLQVAFLTSVLELSRALMSMRRTGMRHFSDKMAMTESCSYASKIYLVFYLVCSVK